MEAMTYTTAKPESVSKLMADDGWVAEQKLDGVRCMVEIVDGEITLLNRRGVSLAAASTNAHRPKIEAAFKELGFTGHWVFDGELMTEDGTLYLFDMPLGAGGEIMPDMKFSRRREALEMLADMVGWDETTTIRLTMQAFGEDKPALLELISEAGGEGVMLKKLDSAYVSKRTRTAGFKVKLTKDVDCVVMERDIDGKDNQTLGVYDGGILTEIGRSSTIGKEFAPVGSVVEVRCLYVGDNGRLYQPRQMRVRGDKLPTECTIDQLDGLKANRAVV